MRAHFFIPIITPTAIKGQDRSCINLRVIEFIIFNIYLMSVGITWVYILCRKLFELISLNILDVSGHKLNEK